MATHSSILAWRIPWTEDVGGLQSLGLQRISELSLSTPSLRGEGAVPTGELETSLCEILPNLMCQGQTAPSDH